MPRCPKEKIRNPETGRCVKRNGAIGKRILRERKLRSAAKDADVAVIVTEEDDGSSSESGEDVIVQKRTIITEMKRPKPPAGVRVNVLKLPKSCNSTVEMRETASLQRGFMPAWMCAMSPLSGGRDSGAGEQQPIVDEKHTGTIGGTDTNTAPAPSVKGKPPCFKEVDYYETPQKFISDLNDVIAYKRRHGFFTNFHDQKEIPTLLGELQIDISFDRASLLYFLGKMCPYSDNSRLIDIESALEGLSVMDVRPSPEEIDQAAEEGRNVDIDVSDVLPDFRYISGPHFAAVFARNQPTGIATQIRSFVSFEILEKDDVKKLVVTNACATEDNIDAFELIMNSLICFADQQGADRIGVFNPTEKIKAKLENMGFTTDISGVLFLKKDSDRYFNGIRSYFGF